MSSFASWFYSFCSPFFDWCYEAFQFLLNYFTFCLKWLFEQSLQVLDYVLSTLPDINFMSEFWSLFGQFGSDLRAFCGVLRVDDCIQILLIAYGIRTILRFIPAIRLGN